MARSVDEEMNREFPKLPLEERPEVFKEKNTIQVALGSVVALNILAGAAGAVYGLLTKQNPAVMAAFAASAVDIMAPVIAFPAIALRRSKRK